MVWATAKMPFATQKSRPGSLRARRGFFVCAMGKRRLADEYDAAQERGDVQSHGGQGKRDIPHENIPTVGDIGLTAKEVHEARAIRDAGEVENLGRSLVHGMLGVEPLGWFHYNTAWQRSAPLSGSARRRKTSWPFPRT